MVDRVAGVEAVKFVVEDLKFQRELARRRLVEIAHHEKLAQSAPQLRFLFGFVHSFSFVRA